MLRIRENLRRLLKYCDLSMIITIVIFLNSKQPQTFFEKLKISTSELDEGEFTPIHGGFKVWLPDGYRSMNYPSEMELPGGTFILEATNNNGSYYSVRHRQ